MPKVAIVILNWNGIQFLEIFLRIVIDRSCKDAEIWVADNGSTDDSIRYLETNFHGEVNILKLDKNYGYTGGYNRALSQISADYYLLLNSDIEVTDGWLKPLISAMDEDLSIAAIQPKILSFAQKDHFEYAGASGGFIDVLGYPFCRGRFVGQKCEIDNGQYDDFREIFWATGAALMVRGEYFHQIGRLDDLFFAHMEEIDLCWRFKRAGYKIMVEPKSVVYHVGGGTLPIWSPNKTYLNFRNNISMLYKNLSRFRFVITYFLRIWTDLLRWASYIAVFKFAFANAVMRGHIDFWKMRAKLNRQDEIGHDSVPHIYHGSIILKQLFGNGTFGKMMTLLICLLIQLSCSNGSQATNLIKVQSPSRGAGYLIGDEVIFKIKENKPVDSINIFVDNKKVDKYKVSHVGKIEFRIIAYKNGKTDSHKGYFLASSNRVPDIKAVTVIKEYPHASDGYTQGLIMRDGMFYESDGQYGESTIRLVEPETGKVILKRQLADNIFAEGLECLDGVLYQLSWKENTCFKYDSASLKLLGTQRYDGEGWGLATDGKFLYMSDGTHQIKVIEPHNGWNIIRTFDVQDQRGNVNLINEMEWIDGKLWANIYSTNWIAIINPETGEVETYIDCSALKERINMVRGVTDVLNGIAYNPKTEEIYLTGKYWNKLFVIKK